MFFQLFWFPVFFMVPLLTMKSFAEERLHWLQAGDVESALAAATARVSPSFSVMVRAMDSAQPLSSMRTRPSLRHRQPR